MTGLGALPGRVATRTRRRFRELTNPWRQPPRLLIIGAQKAGTTSLYRYLVEHPQVLPGTVKEVRYFNAHYERGWDWYRSHFPLARAVAHGFSGATTIALEASTGYLPSPAAPGRVAADLPDAKLVVLLRDPVERAWSHYRHSLRDGHETLAFGEALAAEESRLAAYHRAQEAGEPPGRAYSFHSYLARGRYHEQLLRWFAACDRGRFLVRSSDELFTQPERLTNEVLAFLGLGPLARPSTRADFAAHNAGTARGDMPARERALLKAYFAPHNERLYELLGWDAVWG